MFDNRQGSGSGLAALLRLAQSRTYANWTKCRGLDVDISWRGIIGSDWVLVEWA